MKSLTKEDILKLPRDTCPECNKEIIPLEDINISNEILGIYEASAWGVNNLNLTISRIISGELVIKGKDVKGILDEILSKRATYMYMLKCLEKDLYDFYNIPKVRGYYLEVVGDVLCYHKY